MLQKEAVEQRTLELLTALQTDNMFSQFHLAGGTGLALHLGHRLSADLDMFSIIPFDSESNLEYLEMKYHFVSDFNAVNTLKGSIENIKVDFISHLYKLIMPVTESGILRVYSQADIAAMKINAIAGNGTRSKDFVDLYFLLQNYTVEQLLGFYKIKYNDRSTFHALKSLNYFDEVDLSDWPVLIKEKTLTWKKVKSTIDKQCKSYFKSI